MSYALTCCSTADLTAEHFAARDIQYVCFHFTLDGTVYPDDLGQSVPFPQFYEAMANGADTSTSQVNISQYLEFFTPILESGKDILHVSLSSGLSGSYNSASSAALILRSGSSSLSARSTLWTLWAPPPATVCLWSCWPTSGTPAPPWTNCTHGLWRIA